MGQGGGPHDPERCTESPQWSQRRSVTTYAGPSPGVEMKVSLVLCRYVGGRLETSVTLRFAPKVPSVKTVKSPLPSPSPLRSVCYFITPLLLGHFKEETQIPNRRRFGPPRDGDGFTPK